MFSVIVIAIVALLVFSGLGLFLLKIGVIFNQVSKPSHLDHGTYTLDQGREVGNESVE